MLVLELCLEGQASNLTHIWRPAELLSAPSLLSHLATARECHFFFFFLIKLWASFLFSLPFVSVGALSILSLSHSPERRYLPEGGAFTSVWCLGLCLRVRFTSRVLVLRLVSLFYVWVPGFAAAASELFLLCFLALGFMLLGSAGL